MARNEIIKMAKSGGGFVPTPDSRLIFDKYREKIKTGGVLFLKVITPKKARSLKHHNRYHAIILPTIGNNMPSVEHLVTANSEGVSYDDLHRYLLFKFAYEGNHPEIIELQLTMNKNGDMEKKPFVSESFSRMSQKTFEEYEKYLDKIYTEETGVSLLETINQTA
jgi:hypothetical protein